MGEINKGKPHTSKILQGRRDIVRGHKDSQGFSTSYVQNDQSFTKTEKKERSEKGSNWYRRLGSDVGGNMVSELGEPYN